MPDAILAGALALGMVAAAAALLVHQRHRRSVVKLRSERHDIMVIAVNDWLEQPAIVMEMVREGVVSPSGLLAFREVLGRMTERRFFAAVAALVDRRSIRLAISRHVQRRHGGNHRRVMAELYRIVQDAKGTAA